MKYAFLIVSILLGGSAFGQSFQLERADRLFDRLAYRPAMEAYGDIVARDGANQHALLRLGDCHRLVSEYAEAATWYGRASAAGELPDDYRLVYGMMLQADGRCEEALAEWEAYTAAVPTDSRGVALADACREAMEMEGEGALYRVEPVAALNSTASDFGPALLEDALVFASDRREGLLVKRRHAWTGRAFLDLWKAESLDSGFAAPAPMDGVLNGRWHDGTPAFDSDGMRVWFTRNGPKDEGAHRRLAIYESRFDEGSWTDPVAMPFCSPKWSTSHPAPAEDGNTLVFSSDRPDGYGGTDLWMARRDGDTWSEPVNLGPEVNTEGNESFPFLHVEGTLYFASDGHGGFGGLDLFAADFDGADSRGVRHLGAELNSRYDDFGLIWNEEGDRGFFSSNREGSRGADDIYRVERVFLRLTGRVVDEATGRHLEAAAVRLVEGGPAREIASDPSGGFAIDVAPVDAWVLSARLEGYEPAEVTVEPGVDGVPEVRIGLHPLAVYGGEVTSGGRPVAGAEVSLFNGENTVLLTVKTDEEGRYAFPPIAAGSYEAEAFAGELLPDRGSARKHLVLRLEPEFDCRFPIVYFDFGKHAIRPEAEAGLREVVEVLDRFPDMKVEVISHCDSRSSAAFNARLAKRRTDATADWLIARGVDSNRLIRRAAGEGELANTCGDGVDCPEDEHQFNRRTEFRCAQR